MVVAHRACWGPAPENSVRAIEECIRLGVDMVEMDVRKTRDGHLVVMHDETVDRMTDDTGLVSGFTLYELAKLRLREGQGGVDAPLTEYGVPALAELLAAVEGRILVNLDAKSDTRDDAYALAEQMGTGNHVLMKMPLASVQDVGAAEVAPFPNSYFMPIVREEWGALDRQVSALATLTPVAFEIIYRTEKQLELACAAAAELGARCWVNTMWDRLSPGHSDKVSVHDPDRHWGHLIRLGVNMIQTDHPEELILYLERHGLRLP
jgi:glycerophosphoryl diester phosphodiesterase